MVEADRETRVLAGASAVDGLGPDPSWRPLHGVGGVSARIFVGMLVVAIALSIATPAPPGWTRTMDSWLTGDDRSSAVLRAARFSQCHRHHVPVRVEVAYDQARLTLGRLSPDTGHPVNAGG